MVLAMLYEVTDLRFLVIYGNDFHVYFHTPGTFCVGYTAELVAWSDA